MRKHVNLVDELGDELAWALFVEKRFSGDFSPEKARALIGQVKGVLNGYSETRAEIPSEQADSNASVSAH
jgi:hypothetical protein